MKLDKKALGTEALELLKQLIAIPSFSEEEDETATLIDNWLQGHGVATKRQYNNIYSFNKYYDENKPNLLLNSHHDTVKPNKAYTKDPFHPHIEDGKLYGLGSNDAGGALCSLLATFVHFYEREDLSYNIIMSATAEEEDAGDKSISALLPILPEIDVAIVGEPTQMQLAIAEKGLVVFEGTVEGTPSHAAHPNDNNAIYNTIQVLEWFKNYQFEKVSDVLGPVKMTVTQIKAGSQHNVVPAQVDLVIDTRVNDCYTNEEINEMLQREAPCKLRPRSLNLSSSSIPIEHPLVQSGIALGRETYGSPTLSDQAELSCQSLKLGPGYSPRSHSADEFIYVDEVYEGVQLYIDILEGFLAN
ncbi:M20 family metallo-hydrolase [Flavobacterium sp. ASW18X]|uniref:M20 family metallo-hydrolase n=1 Tax=Flavobacterium sp. ASW18X TaxID=2572595 RepID=UPI0010AE4F18|nr:M20 family metallo-hydrolase [Flavobacterium sp. ASW18X]TKD61004.1 M20/M25/M40 family metallo-hydrolase [Flavobacterium sp. ASW18X]